VAKAEPEIVGNPLKGISCLSCNLLRWLKPTAYLVDWGATCHGSEDNMAKRIMMEDRLFTLKIGTIIASFCINRFLWERL